MQKTRERLQVKIRVYSGVESAVTLSALSLTDEFSTRGRMKSSRHIHESDEPEGVEATLSLPWMQVTISITAENSVNRLFYIVSMQRHFVTLPHMIKKKSCKWFLFSSFTLHTHRSSHDLRILFSPLNDSPTERENSPDSPTITCVHHCKYTSPKGTALLVLEGHI